MTLGDRGVILLIDGCGCRLRRAAICPPRDGAAHNGDVSASNVVQEGSGMTDREHSTAYAMLPRRPRRVLAAIQRAIGDRTSATVSYTEFRFDHHIGRQSISPSVKLLDHLGLIDIEPGPRLVNVFRFSNRWRTVDAVEAVRLELQLR
jgi:hypothetical protein